MPTDSKTYLGINRAISDYSPSKACEELINLRPSSDGLIPVKPFNTLATSLAVSRIFEHKTNGGTNYIALKYYSGRWRFYLLNNWAMPQSSFGDIAGSASNEVYFATAGNIIVFSNKNAPENKAYRWNGSVYAEIEANIPTINASFYDGDDADPFFGETETPVAMDDNAPDSVRSVISSCVNQIQENNPDVCFGGIVVALAYKTTDGHTFWTNQWLYYDPTARVNDKYKGTSQEFYYTSEENWEDLGIPALYNTVAPYFDNNDYAYVLWVNSNGTGSPVRCAGSKVKLRLSLTSGTWDSASSMIESVEVYCSKPELYFEFGDLLYSSTVVAPVSEGSESTTSTTFSAALAAPRKHKEMNLGDQLLYYQASIPLANIPTSGNLDVNLRFGGNNQLTSRTLDVDAGAVKRFGKMLSYNARFHFYDSKRAAYITSSSVSFRALDPADQTPQSSVYVRYTDGEKEYLVNLGSNISVPHNPSNMMILAASQNITEVIVKYSTSPAYYGYLMTPSTRYNYSVHVGSYDSAPTTAPSGTMTPPPIITEEKAPINVSEQYNPFVFMVEHSYLAPATVDDLQPQMAGMQDTSYGTYPLNVFTPRGIYALMQGSGTVLYSKFRPITDMVSVSNSVPTNMGTFILGSRGLWLIAGTNAVLVSDALHEGPHKYIRDCIGYQKLSGPSNPAPEDPEEDEDYWTSVYDVSSYVSDPTFLQYIMGNGSTVPMATLSYNRFRDEIYISNSAYAYTYALSLKYRQWFKIDKKLRQDTIAGDVVIVPGSDSIDILDLENEAAPAHILVHLQSRPFSYGYSYAHIHRLVSMVRARLARISESPEEFDELCLALYGSDNLRDWTLLSGADRRGTVLGLKFSQIRTAPAARSWRYYTICIGGNVPDDTDFGPVLVDYKPVIRRIG